MGGVSEEQPPRQTGTDRTVRRKQGAGEGSSVSARTTQLGAVANSPKDREPPPKLAYLWNNWEGNNQHVAKRLDHTDTAQVKRFVRKALENVIAENVYADRNAPREDTRFSNFVERAARLQLEKALLQEDMTAA